MSRPGPPNPYARQAEDVRDPPRRFREKIPYLGPGLIVVASIVGSGELITTTALGGMVGFSCLWLILLSCISKTMMMEELGRFTISSGETALESFNKLPGPKRQRGADKAVGWFMYLWVLMAVPNIITGGGVIGGLGQIMDLAFPLGHRLGLAGDKLWAVIMFAVTMTLILSGRFLIIEAACTGMVLTFSVATVICAIMLQWTKYAVTWSDIVEGLRFHLPAGSIVLAMGAYGGTGTQPGESMAYTYWCLEKGYARYAGHADGSEPWLRRARGWIGVMQLDVCNVMLIFTVATLAFYVLGAAVLKPMIDHGEILLKAGEKQIDGPTTMASLANMYTQTLGPWARWLYLVGGFCVLYSTVVSGWSAGGRFWSDMLGVVGLIDASDYRKRLKYIRLFSFIAPALTTLSYLCISKIVLLLAIGGIISTLMTPIVAVATVYLRYRRTDHRIAPTRAGDLALWSSVALMVAFTPIAMWFGSGDVIAAWDWVRRLR